jgi:hypothetical protein
MPIFLFCKNNAIIFIGTEFGGNIEGFPIEFVPNVLRVQLKETSSGGL